jgi:hypothetical protein
MKSSDLKHWQAARINDVVRPTVAYLSRLKRRMEKRGFPPDDRLFRLVTQAHASMQDLSMELHCLSCGNGVGRNGK